MTEPIRYCPACGHSVEDRTRYGKVRRVCPQCGYIHFADPKVAAATLVDDGGKILLVKRGVEPERGKWGLPGGYVDWGEDPIQAAIRETAEETGLRVEITGLLEVIFSARQVIVISYAARLIDGTLGPADDVDDVGWFAPDELPELAFESTQQLVNRWIERLNGSNRGYRGDRGNT